MCKLISAHSIRNSGNETVDTTMRPTIRTALSTQLASTIAFTSGLCELQGTVGIGFDAGRFSNHPHQQSGLKAVERGCHPTSNLECVCQSINDDGSGSCRVDSLLR